MLADASGGWIASIDDLPLSKEASILSFLKNLYPIATTCRSSRRLDLWKQVEVFGPYRADEWCFIHVSKKTTECFCTWGGETSYNRR